MRVRGQSLVRGPSHDAGQCPRRPQTGGPQTGGPFDRGHPHAGGPRRSRASLVVSSDTVPWVALALIFTVQ